MEEQTATGDQYFTISEAIQMLRQEPDRDRANDMLDAINAALLAKGLPLIAQAEIEPDQLWKNSRIRAGNYTKMATAA